MIYRDDIDPKVWAAKHGMDYHDHVGSCGGCGEKRYRLRPYITKDYVGIEYRCTTEDCDGWRWSAIVASPNSPERKYMWETVFMRLLD